MRLSGYSIRRRVEDFLKNTFSADDIRLLKIEANVKERKWIVTCVYTRFWLTLWEKKREDIKARIVIDDEKDEVVEYEVLEQ